MKKTVAVIGGSKCDGETFRRAFAVGEGLARAGCDVLTGGLTGVMEGASAGAREGGGHVIGVLPGADPATANPHVQTVIATGMGDARNAIITNSAAGFVAIDGAEGTLSEIAFALKRGKPVVSLGSWDVDPRVHQAHSPEDAVRWILAALA